MMKAKKVPTPVISGDAPMPRMVVGNIASAPCPPVKTSGIRVRGGKAQTKGFMARGPMA